MTLRARVLPLLLSVLSTLDCDRSPTAPSSPEPPSYSLRAGNYVLTIAVRSTISAPPNPCVEVTTAADRAAVPVVVEPQQGKWRVRPIVEADLGLVATLESPSRNLLIGPIEGRARDIETGVIVSIEGLAAVPGFTSSSPPSLFGSLMAANVADGAVNGQVRFSGGNGSRVCAANVWRLDPR